MSSDLSTLPRARQAGGLLRPSGRRGHLPSAMAGDILRAADGAIIVASGLALPAILENLAVNATFLTPIVLPEIFREFLPWIVILGAVLGVWMLDNFGAYRPEALHGKLPVLARLAGGFVMVFIALATLDALSNPPETRSIAALGVWNFVAFAGCGAIHLGVQAFARTRVGHARLAETVVIGGSPELVEGVLTRLGDGPGGPYRLLGFFGEGLGQVVRRFQPQEPGSEIAEGIPVLGRLEDLPDYVREHGADQVLLALPWQDQARAARLAQELSGLAVDVNLVVDFDALPLNCRGVARLGELDLLRVADSPLRQWRGVAKTIEDYAIAILALPLLIPLFAVIALLIRLESPGPVFFRQRRDGFNNIPITVYKFRTMRDDLCDLSGGQQTKRDDPRVTRIGAFLRKTSLDELPQIINVLRGEMSLVGPRPHPLGMRTEERLCHEIVADYAHRHRMKPGLTGWAQINGYRGAVETSEELRQRVALDLQYIENWSIMGDLRIIALTVTTLLGHKNAF